MTIRQISVFVENRAGCLTDIIELLSKENVDIRALSIADTTGYGVLRLIVNNPQAAALALSKADYLVSVTDVFAVPIQDKPGGLSSVVRTLSDNGVNIEYLYAFVARNHDNLAYVVIRPEDNALAERVLVANNIPSLSADEICNI